MLILSTRCIFLFSWFLFKKMYYEDVFYKVLDPVKFTLNHVHHNKRVGGSVCVGGGGSEIRYLSYSTKVKTLLETLSNSI